MTFAKFYPDFFILDRRLTLIICFFSWRFYCTWRLWVQLTSARLSLPSLYNNITWYDRTSTRLVTTVYHWMISCWLWCNCWSNAEVLRA